ncbi:MAG TPA: hypothetical protein VH120_05555 [Gemmataceae bacterium]|nr:hypothetical protein [Gemmataceae bacterium]
MNASEIRLHGIPGEVRDDRCHWCEATLSEPGRQRRVEPRYAIDGGRRVLVEVELWACLDCAEQAEPLTESHRADLQRRLDEMTPPVVGRCEACEQDGEIFPHFDQDEGDEYLLCERCFFEAP